MYGLEPLLLDPAKFERRFRSESGGFIYDPSLGKASGRPVSDREARDAIHDFRELHDAQELRVNRAARFLLPSIFAISVFLLAIGQARWLIVGILGCLGIQLLITISANWYLASFSSRMWRRVERRPESHLLPVAEQIRRGYRMSWKSRVTFTFWLALAMPAYIYGHVQHDILSGIPLIGETVNTVYWLAFTVAGFLFFLYVCRLAVRQFSRERRLSGTSNKPKNPKKQSTFGKRKAAKPGTQIRPYGRGDLSGVEKNKWS